MSKPRLMSKRLSLPMAPAVYDPKVLQETVRAIENHVQSLQPAQQRQVVTGAKAGNAALTNLITALVSLGFITDSTT